MKKNGKITFDVDGYKPNVPVTVEPRLDIQKIKISIVFNEEVKKGAKYQQRAILKVYPHELEKTLARYRSKDPIVLDK